MTQGMLKNLIAVLLLGCFCVMALAQQTSSTTRYIYDANGRLRAVVTPTGEAAVYDYDPAGNITAIRRLAADALELIGFSPQVGTPLDRVTIYGVGIGNGLTSVSFNGVPARVLSSSPVGIVVEVPTNATTGPITIVTARGSVSTAPFTVRGIGITPQAIIVDSTEQAQFRAFVANLSGDQAVQWRVNGIAGGDNTVGTITNTGLYTAPLLPNDVQRRDFIIRATSLSDPDLLREASITVRGLSGILGLSARPISVYLTPSGALTTSLLQPVAPAISVYLTPTGTLTTSLLQPTAPAVAVYLTPAGALTTIMLQPTAQAISVYLTPTGALTTSTLMPASQAVSVYLTPSGSLIASTLQPPAAAVSVTTGPIITAIAPANLPRGGNVTVTLNGANFSAVTRLIILQNNAAADANITVTNLIVSPTGTSLTATLSANANTTDGPRWLVVATGTVSSPIFAGLQIVAP